MRFPRAGTLPPWPLCQCPAQASCGMSEERERISNRPCTHCFLKKDSPNDKICKPKGKGTRRNQDQMAPDHVQALFGGVPAAALSKRTFCFSPQNCGETRLSPSRASRQGHSTDGVPYGQGFLRSLQGRKMLASPSLGAPAVDPSLEGAKEEHQNQQGRRGLGQM